MFFTFLVPGAPSSFAQEGGVRLLRVSGDSFSLSTGGERKIFSSQDIGTEGMELHRGDMLQTGAESFAEIGVSGCTLLAAENTSVAFRGDFIELVYGRVRLYGSAASVLTVRSAAADVLYRGNDTGIDYAYETSRAGFNEPVLRVYGFGGQADLVCRGERASAPSYTIDKNGTMFLRYTASHSYVERGTLEENIVDYWNAHVFTGPRLSLEVKEEVKIEPEIQIRYETPDYTPYISRNRLKNTALLSGTVFVLLGGGMAAFGHYAPSYVNRSQADIINAAGYSSMGFGIFALFSSMLINPAYPAR
ncbi:MAG: hypothetical protein LBG42_01775 [Treponema sp.]|nr:hypothetical protein [Treponema sp.]